ncbi:MAG: hemin ABC transporter substrate-binding protein [Tropicimonas sp.]|uniref:heme/hemin ABC transporter substrate-binding protein n=1 Tax=Tropicimonas sp. TaxID=2067044 RepID=UPI003A8B161E
MAEQIARPQNPRPTASLAGHLALAAGLLFAPLAQAEGPAAQRIVSVGGAVTEIVYALGQQDRLVARDMSSDYPPEAGALPDIGYMRRLSPEGVLSVKPDLVIAIEGAGPPEAVEVLAGADIAMATIPEGYSRAAVGEKIRAVGAALGEEAAAADLATTVDAEIAAAVAQAAAHPGDKRVLFVLTTQGGRVMAGGRETAADAIITMAGATNAVSDFEGYKPLSDEAVIRAAPQVILMMASDLAPTGTDEELFAHPAIAATPAGLSHSLVRIDAMHLLGFGPRTASAVTALAEALSKAGRS